jgi:hypothetical protein
MSEDAQAVVVMVGVSVICCAFFSILFARLFQPWMQSLAEWRADLLKRTLEVERDAAEETVRLRAEATRLLLERWRKEADIDEVRMKLAAIEAMGYEWRWTKSIDENGEQVGAWVMRHEAAEADANNKAWRKSDGE